MKLQIVRKDTEANAPRWEANTPSGSANIIRERVNPGNCGHRYRVNWHIDQQDDGCTVTETLKAAKRLVQEILA